MKKTVSVIVAAAVIIASLLSFNAFAASTRTQTLLDKLGSTDQVTVTLTAGSTLLGSSTDTFTLKGNDLAYDYGTGLLKVRVILHDGKAYAFLPILPLFYVEVENTGLSGLNAKSLLEKATGLTLGILSYQKTYDETIDGKAYSVEEFTDRAQVTLKFCYEGDTLKLLRVIDARTNSVQNTYFENISFTVPDSAVAVPGGINLTPIFKNLFSSLLNYLVKQPVAA